MSLLIKSEIKKCHCILVTTVVPSNEFSFRSRNNVVKKLKKQKSHWNKRIVEGKEKWQNWHHSPITYTQKWKAKKNYKKRRNMIEAQRKKCKITKYEII